MITLYGTPSSLYVGRARSYLIKAGIEYQEMPQMSAYFMESVLPKSGNRHGIPTIEFPDGVVIRDGVAIIDHFEQLSGYSFSPTTPRQCIVSRLLDTIGAEGMLRPAMHYRWNFDQDNKEFIDFHFNITYSDAVERMRFIREIVVPAWGVAPDAHELIESHYLETLQKLNAHFSDYPYFLGGKPSIGDFGMIAPLYGHLGRDPKPLSLMQKHAVRLFRWVERMNRPESSLGEFSGMEQAYLSDDEVPDTLIAVLKHFAIDFVPESRAACDCINTWIDDNADVAPLTEVERGVGTCEFEVQGVRLSADAQPFRFYVLKRLQDDFDALDEADQADVVEMLSACNMREVLDLRLSRAIGRHNNLEVWL